MRRTLLLAAVAALGFVACPGCPTPAGTDGGSGGGGGGGAGGGSGGGSGGGGVAGGSGGGAEDGGTDAGSDGGLRCSTYNPLKNPYFGDLHSHTSYSFDAFTFDTRNTPFDAYAFAKGRTLQVAGATATGGGPLTNIGRPLDFLAVTDHSEWLALAYGCGDQLDGGPQGQPRAAYYDDPICVQFRSTNPAIEGLNFTTAGAMQRRLCDGGNDCAPVIQSAWQSEQAAAAAAYEPCRFTSLVAYEWTHAQVTDGGNATLHKNIIFGSDRVPAQPIDSLTYSSQAQLWTALDEQCLADAGCEVITIPHNSNLSRGLAFNMAAAAEPQAAKYQRLIEIFQHKGGSECFYDPNNPTDPTCEFEYLGGITEPNLPRSYVRTALKEGLVAWSANGLNPLQLGIVGATDDHNGAPGNVNESTFPGHAGRLDDSPARRIGGVDPDAGRIGVAVGHNPGGVAVVWAEQNTRESIFAALMRRETYGTSGPRLVVRFFQTWDTAGDPCADPDFPAQLVAAGAVPMGGTMSAAPDGGADGGLSAPRLVVYAWKDQTELARVDIVKGWVDQFGQMHESVLQSPVTPGTPACVSWVDPAFTGTATFYYARVLEQPTPRWSAYDCAGNPSPACADGGLLNRTIQERAWTSPIWYLP